MRPCRAWIPIAKAFVRKLALNLYASGTIFTWSFFRELIISNMHLLRSILTSLSLDHASRFGLNQLSNGWCVPWSFFRVGYNPLSFYDARFLLRLWICYPFSLFSYFLLKIWQIRIQITPTVIYGCIPIVPKFFI